MKFLALLPILHARLCEKSAGTSAKGKTQAKCLLVRAAWLPICCVLVLLLLSFAFASNAAESPADGAFAEANRAYEVGKYAEAALLYQAVVSNAPTAAAWFNLGNAQFKAGRLGLAIASWRKAEQITPRDSALRANLNFARTKLSDASPEPGWIRTAMRYLRIDEWSIIASVAIALGFLMLAWTELRHASTSRITIALIFAVGLLAASVVAATFTESVRRKQAVVIAKQAPVRFGPLEDSQTAFQLSDGAEAEVLDSAPGWYQIRDASGRTGWTRWDAVVLISP